MRRESFVRLLSPFVHKDLNGNKKQHFNVRQQFWKRNCLAATIKKAHHEIWQKPTDTSPYFGTMKRTSHLCECEFPTLFNAALADSQQYVSSSSDCLTKWEKPRDIGTVPESFWNQTPAIHFANAWRLRSVLCGSGVNRSVVRAAPFIQLYASLRKDHPIRRSRVDPAVAADCAQYHCTTSPWSLYIEFYLQVKRRFMNRTTEKKNGRCLSDKTDMMHILTFNVALLLFTK